MSDFDCERELIRCRDRTSPAALESLEKIRKRAEILELEDTIRYVQETLESRQHPFRDHPVIAKFLKQFDKSNYAVYYRRRSLVLLGDSQQGKTQKGMSLWGKLRTLKVSCGNCPPGALPSLVTFQRKCHDAILFDECRIDQILKNRDFFQGNEFLQTLGQSNCNPFAYKVWVYNIALIICTNDFNLKDESLTPAERDWLEKNCFLLQLDESLRWYCNTTEITKPDVTTPA